ncbi:alpha-E domain-containing protein [Brytella acorum]|uniref:Alpha-E domain-containing protein n=1 Tax=Brytella acorum TaxID=2959299 RepID=A0AA35Y0G1_9PROT|nr:alpha-E domain-containing protein [Brytella acorum]MDF3624537.1 alpha-E domain-containing protein [Brytella acorum]CAI9119614.1 alpha-E domain-containing protein [Brytella acorum]
MNGPVLLSRYAENMLWLARYMERIENLARLIDVNETFVRLRTVMNGWQCILDINTDSDTYFLRHEKINGREVLSFYVLDRDNPNSIISMALAARENARALRPIIPTEMWTHLNVFTNFVRDLTLADIAINHVSSLCARIKEGCQTHAGIMEGTLFRDQAWLFHQIGKHIERGDQITRLIDIKYQALLPEPAMTGSEIDASQWTAVLRSAAGYHAFRRLFPNDLTPASVVGFLLKSHGFPRSLATSLRQAHHAVHLLRSDYGFRDASEGLEHVENLRNLVTGVPTEEIILAGLHEFLDGVQDGLASTYNAIARTFWPFD